MSDAFWVQTIGPQRSELSLFINGKRFSGLLDTDADISVVTASQWPSKWQKTEIITQLQGIGQNRNPEQSSNKLH